jgi:hypothetical protein
MYACVILDTASSVMARCSGSVSFISSRYCLALVSALAIGGNVQLDTPSVGMRLL